MASYAWHPQMMREVFVLPSAVVDENLKLATAEQLQVLLWLSRHHLRFEAAECAAALGLSEAECEGCLRFWEERGVLQGEQEPQPSVTGKVAATVRPAAVKPRAQDVLEYQKQHADFSLFLEAASARLGKPLSHGDTATLLYLLDTVGLSGDVILLEIAYAVSLGKGNMRYVEKLALDWADRELTTLSAVDEHIVYLERCRVVGDRVEQLVLPPRPFTTVQRETAVKWVEDWHISDELLRLAAAIAHENAVKAGRFVAYMDGILHRWQAEGIDTPAKAEAARLSGKKKGAAATNPEQSSLDMDDFDAALLRYRPHVGNKP